MISCFIWPSINSWRHHNGLRTQNVNLHIMTSAYLWKIDCSSVNIVRFSSKFWYVLVEKIYYKYSKYYPSFWQRHHGVFLRLKEACQFFTFCVYSLWDMTFSQKLDSTFPSFASNIYVVLASFTLNFEYVVAETIRYISNVPFILSRFFVWSAHLYLFQTSITNLVVLKKVK